MFRDSIMAKAYPGRKRLQCVVFALRTNPVRPVGAGDPSGDRRLIGRRFELTRRGVMQLTIARASLGAVAVCALLLAGCTAEAEPPAPTDTVTAAPSPTRTADPEFVEGGTAGQNRPYFEFVVEGLLAQTPAPTSGMIVDALAAAGFDKAAMEVTAEATPTGQPADSILFAVQIDGQCLIGQVKEASFTSQLADVLGTGRCLVGRTLSIDW